jgi:hypothetical protein
VSVRCAIPGLAALTSLLLAAARPSTAPAPPPKPLNPDSLLLAESFDDADLLKRGWYDGDRFRIVPAAFSGKGCAEYEWLARGSGAVGTGPVRRLFEPTDEVFVRFYLRLSKNFAWTRKGFHPHLVNILTTENDKFAGPAATRLTLYVEPCDGKLRLAAQDIQNKDTPHGLTQGPLKGGYNGTFFDSKDALFTDDQWHCIEAQFKLNTLSADDGVRKQTANPDGVVRGWFDGRLVVERTDVLLRSPDYPKMKFNQLLIAPYFGPGLLPQPQKLWIDEMAVGRERVGPAR